MARGHGRGSVVALGTVLAGMLLGWCPGALALNPALDVSQYAHTAWKIRDGFTKGRIVSIAQTPDGYLWLGTEFGLLRFDGVKNVPWQPPAGQHLPSNWIVRLLAARDGALWIGTDKGVASWKNGRLTQYPELAGQFIFALLEDRDGSVWVGAYSFSFPAGKLCAIHNGRVQCYAENGELGRGVLSLYEDSKGNLWAVAQNGLWRWKPGTQNSIPRPVNRTASALSVKTMTAHFCSSCVPESNGSLTPRRKHIGCQVLRGTSEPKSCSATARVVCGSEL
jgi:ligand-binding sensor domain-containing protein